MLSHTDGELLEQFRSGHDWALEMLCERYEPQLFPFLLGLLRDHHLAEDVLQETFVKAIERSQDVEAGKFRGWLFTVAYREAMLARRRLKRQPTYGEESLPVLTDPGLPPEIVAESAEQASRLRELIEQLPVGQREVIRARIYDGKRFHEIAAAMGCPLNTTLARMHAGLKRLRTMWEQNHA